MASDSGFATYILEEVLGDVPGIASRKMFGGYGLYKNGVIFGMIIRDKVYFKATARSKKLFEEVHAEPFTYEHNKSGKTVVMPYYEVPEEILENSDSLHLWVDSSVQIGKK